MTETNGNKQSCGNLCNLVVRKRKMLKDERGQMSIDFLAGLSLFMLTLLFLVQFIPGMFVPFQTETIDLSSVSYRTSVILVEDPGWWDNVSDNGEDWETDNHLANVSRVGLAIDKKYPNMLNMRKINVFNDTSQIDNENLTDKLGLYRNIGGNEIDYGYNITIADSDKNILAARGDPIPEYGDVSSMKRTVSVNTTRYGYLLEGNLSGAINPTKTLIIINSSNVSRFTAQDITFTISNFNITGVSPKYQGTKVSHDTHPSGTGLKLTAPKTLSGTSDGYVSVNYGTQYKINQNMAINSPSDVLVVIIKKEAWAIHGIDTTGSDDIFIEIEVNQIEVAKVDFEADVLDLQETEKSIQDPSILIVKIWT